MSTRYRPAVRLTRMGSQKQPALQEPEDAAGPRRPRPTGHRPASAPAPCSRGAHPPGHGARTQAQ